MELSDKVRSKIRLDSFLEKLEAASPQDAIDAKDVVLVMQYDIPGVSPVEIFDPKFTAQEWAGILEAEETQFVDAAELHQERSRHHKNDEPQLRVSGTLHVQIGNSRPEADHDIHRGYHESMHERTGKPHRPSLMERARDERERKANRRPSLMERAREEREHKANRRPSLMERGR